MTDYIKTEEEYREILQRFLELLNSQEDEHDSILLFEMMKLLENYEQDNCM
jgi:hypothetical protein